MTIRASSSNPPMPFIVGVGRSGTTLLRMILDSHPAMAIPPETHFIPALCLLNGEGDSLRDEFYRTVVQTQTWGDFHLSKEDFYEFLRALKPFTLSEGLRCFYRMYAQRFRKPRWGDKTPLYNLHMQAIQQLLPEAHFIHMIRDGRDVAVSLRGLWFGPGRDITAQASDWVRRIREARRQAHSCQHYLELRYEDLVRDTTKALKKVCGFIDLPYDSKMENYYQDAERRLDEFTDWRRPDGTVWVAKEQFLEIHRLTKLPPQESRIGRWRREMSEEDRAKFDAIAGELLREFGYET